MTAREECAAWARVAGSLARLRAIEASRLAWRYALEARRRST